MLRLALKSLLANKIRFALTTSTVVIGVGFVVASFVVADSLRSSFDQLSEDIVSGTDFTVRGQLAFGDLTESEPRLLPEELVDQVAAVDGVESAAGTFFIQGITPVDGTGEAVISNAGPVAGSNWTEDQAISQWYLMEGERPQGTGQFAIDISTFESYDFELGRDYQVITPTGPGSFTLTGVMQFGYPENAGLGAVFTIFNTAAAQELFGLEGRVQTIGVRAEPGRDPAEVEAAIASVLPDGTEVVTAETLSDEFSSAFEGFIGVFQTILLVFAFIVLFVSTFIISNTFSIVLGQRIRELSLLRAIGATPAQVRRSVLTESSLIGVAAAALGIGLGMLGALGMRGLFSAFGADLPDGPLPLRLRTVIWAAALGIGLTVASSLLPAVKASRTPPIAGLAEGATGAAATRQRWRSAAGGLLAGVGLLLTLRGLFASFDSTTAQLVSLGVGAGLVFLAVAVLSPLMARTVVSALGVPLGWIFGTSGRLARANAARSPRRTAATAVALTIGLALVTTVAILGESLKSSFTRSLQTTVTADFIVSHAQIGDDLPAVLAEDLRAAGAGRVVAFNSVQAQVGGQARTITGADVDGIAAVANLDVVEGSLEGFDPASGLLLHQDPAGDLGVGPGDELDLAFPNGETRRLRVAAVYSQTTTFWGNWLVDRGLIAEMNPTAGVGVMAVDVGAAGTDAGRAALERALERYPQANLEDRSEFQASAESNLNTLLVLVNVFLGFSLIIALVGIVNTLTLSVFERTREIGLLRAVGMTRRQTRRMIRWEAAVVTLYGALIGIALGLGFGVAIAAAIPADFIDVITVPSRQLLIYLALSLGFGLLAALFPAFRAGRMNVLEAISTED